MIPAEGAVVRARIEQRTQISLEAFLRARTKKSAHSS